MEEFLLRQNIDRYCNLLETAVNEMDRQTIVQLLSEAEANLEQLKQAQADKGATASQS
jgi:uncharacterized membrane protein YvbJ